MLPYAIQLGLDFEMLDPKPFEVSVLSCNLWTQFGVDKTSLKEKKLLEICFS